MPYILRDESGEITAISQSAMPYAGWEEVDQGSKEYLAYLDDAISKEDRFRESDIQLARVLEDLISLLIDRDFIRFTDFPDAAQQRLLDRQGLRSKKSDLNLLDENENF